MKIYTIYTESHASLLNDYFIPSLQHCITNQIQLVVDKIPQLCPTGVYGSNGWFETMLIKVNQHIRACEENMDNKFIYADCDVQFFKPFIDNMIDELEDNDIACQNDVFPYSDRVTYCAGLFICSANDKTLNFFKSVYSTMVAIHKYQDSYNDQTALNDNLYQLKHKLLSEKFYTIAQTTNYLWDNDYNINNIPSNILVHHANWTHGIENKKKLFDYVRSKQQ